MEDELKQVFFNFATYGNRVVHGDQVMMDSRSLQKLCRDSGLTGKKLTSTDIDLMFMNCKTKGERKISFEQFLRVVQLAAGKLNRSHAEVAIQVAGSKPVSNASPLDKPAAKKPTTNAVDRPSSAPQPSNAEPRALPRLHPDWYEVINPNKTCAADAYYYVNRKTQETTWTIPLLIPTSAVTPPPPPPPPKAGVAPREQTDTKKATFPSAQKNASEQHKNEAVAQAMGRLDLGPAPSTPSSTYESETKSENIFDRLTNPKLYTGAHKHRFDPVTGKGKGLDGRDYVAKGKGAMPVNRASKFKGSTNTGSEETVHSISQILRN